MAITKEQKKAMLSELEGILESSNNVTFVTFKGLSVEDTTSLRRQLRSAGVLYKVVKKTLLKRALDAAKLKGDMPELDGEIAIAYSEDLVAPSGEVYAFHKDHQDEIKIVGGVFDGEYKDEVAMNEIATIPPLPVLRGMFVNVINSPIQGLVVSLGQIAEKKEA